MPRGVAIGVGLVGLLAVTGCELLFAPGGGSGRDGPPAFGDGPVIDGPGMTDADAPLDADLTDDEDGDTLPDVTDPCPHVFGTMADGDSDGVGDACDPDPTHPNETRVYFNGFRHDLGGLIPDAGGIMVSGGQLVVPGTPGLATVYLPGAHDGVEVTTQFTVVAAVDDATEDVGIVTGHDAAGGPRDGTSCRFGQSTAAQTELYLELHQVDPPASDNLLDAKVVALPTPVGVVATMLLRQDPASAAASCGCLTTVAGSSGSIRPGQVGLFAAKLDVVFDYLFIIKRE